MGENLRKYNEVFMNIFGAAESELNESFTFESVHKWDSLAHMALISRLEDIFDVMFETEDVLHYGSYLNGIKILERYGVDMKA
ncbi:MAG: acyl carrier protein [Synergistes sp.]|nr:acyl carrier protein [Synergistes sp.]